MHKHEHKIIANKHRQTHSYVIKSPTYSVAAATYHSTGYTLSWILHLETQFVNPGC